MASRSFFLELPCEVRNLIYELAILSCTEAEDVTRFNVTDRPLFSTVAKNVRPPRLRRETDQDERHRHASPGGMLLVNRQLSREFSDEMFHHCKLVGVYRSEFLAHSFVTGRATLSHPSIGSLASRTPLPLHRLRRYEVQMNPINVKSHHGPEATASWWTKTLDHALGFLPSVTHLTLRLTVDGHPATMAQAFMDTQLLAAHNVRVFKKLVTMGFGHTKAADPATAVQVFPLCERVEQYDDATAKFSIVSQVERDSNYCKFYTISQSFGYHWVREQYHASYGEGLPIATYQSTLDAILAGYEKWVANGKPGPFDTTEHQEVRAEITRDCCGRQPHPQVCVAALLQEVCNKALRDL